MNLVIKLTEKKRKNKSAMLILIKNNNDSFTRRIYTEDDYLLYKMMYGEDNIELIATGGTNICN